MWKNSVKPKSITKSCIEYHHAITFQGHWKQKVNYKSLPWSKIRIRFNTSVQKDLRIYMF